MNMLASSSPDLEALAFNYVSFGIFTVVNNLWAWVAVITAAVSFWRIRAAGAASSAFSVKPLPNQQQPQPRTDHQRNASVYLRPADTCIEPPASAADSNILSPILSPSDYCDDVSVTKGKFTLHYYEEDAVRDSGGELTAAVKDCEGDDDDDDYSYECEDWLEKVMRVRMGDMGWYRFQDLTVINGNIVRLWEDDNYCKRW